jgi:hypothetical protein
VFHRPQLMEHTCLGAEGLGFARSFCVGSALIPSNSGPAS